MHFLNKGTAPKRNEAGYVLLTLAAAMVAICGFAGLVMDVGYGAYVRRQAQAAADAGAKAAALEILANQTAAVATAAAKQDTANNGFTDKVGGVTVTVNQPPASGSYVSTAGYAEVIVTKTIPTSFMAILGFSSMNITSRSVGGEGPGSSCIYALNHVPATQNVIVASGGAAIDVNGCGIVDESSNSKALVASGGACITSTSIQVVGSYSGLCITPTPTTGVTSPGDPLEGKYPRPTPAACTATGWKNSALRLSPGTYCGGITVSGTNVTASPGLYILDGGGLTVSGGGNLAGAGVTFFNMDGGSYGAYKPIVISGGSSVQLYAPTSGTYVGLLFYQDPDIPSGDYNQQNTVSGGSSTICQGVLYFPNTPLVYSGGSSNTAAYTIIVADTINFSGSSTFNANYSSLSGGNPIKASAILVE